VLQDDLRAFHAQHFSHASAPEHVLHGFEQPMEEYCEDYHEEDGLGYYPDGSERTLTDEQIAMFRHTEIHTILRKRRHRREKGELSEEGEFSEEGELSEEGEALPDSPHDRLVRAPAHGRPRLIPDVSNVASSAPSTFLGETGTDNIQADRAEKPKRQEWATTSAKTRSRRAKKAKSRRVRKKKERAEQNAFNDGDEESDEWDPWHQANGPDVQKSDHIELDY